MVDALAKKVFYRDLVETSKILLLGMANIVEQIYRNLNITASIFVEILIIAYGNYKYENNEYILQWDSIKFIPSSLLPPSLLLLHTHNHLLPNPEPKPGLIHPHMDII